jgi:small glutamine-rich tetratricopeptide repeat-containing protein alpha
MFQSFTEAKTAPTLGAVAGASVPGGLPNLDFAAALNNPALVSMASRMMTDPSIQNMLSQLSGMNNVDALIETGRQLAMQMNTQNPDLFATIRQQMGNPEDNNDPSNTITPKSESGDPAP